MVVVTLHATAKTSAAVPAPETIEDLRALELALSLRPRPLPWRPPQDERPLR
jgi:hypothetical protein